MRSMEIIINNYCGTDLDSELINKLAKQISRRRYVVSMSFVSKGKMRTLNRKYRKKDKPTDVLSFDMKEGCLLGDVVICPQVAKANARKFGSTFKSEIARLAVHGILHLLGFDHGKKMFDKQDKIVKGAGYA